MMAESLRWYAGKRVFLTGHTGFKGAWLSLWLKHLGAKITGYALAAEPGSLFAGGGIADGMVSIEADIRDAARLRQAMQEAEPEVVIHMAAQSLVRPSYDDPVGTFATNVMGTANLLDVARGMTGIAAIVVVTSDKCYENHGETAPFAETAPMGGSDPYSASKGCTELVATAFARSYFAGSPCTVATARAGNVIGGGDWAIDRIVPDLMRAARTSEPVMIRRPDAVRPWQHVLEPLRGYLLLAQRAATDGQAFSGGWNFGPRYEDAVAVRSIVERVHGLWPRAAAAFATQIDGPHEAALLRLDCGKAGEGLGWHPLLDLDEALALTVDWYREVSDSPGQGTALAARQIADYHARAIDREKEARS